MFIVDKMKGSMTTYLCLIIANYREFSFSVKIKNWQGCISDAPIMPFSQPHCACTQNLHLTSLRTLEEMLGDPSHL